MVKKIFKILKKSFKRKIRGVRRNEQTKSAVSLRVDLSQYKVPTYKITEGVAIGLMKAGFHIERVAKLKSPVVTGRYRSSWKVNNNVETMTEHFLSYERNPKIRVEPMVIYSDWVEDGASSQGAPRSHRSSGFKGYQIAKKTAESEKGTVKKIVESEIRKVLR